MAQQKPPPPFMKRKPGRPRKADAPQLDYSELDRLLVFGQVVRAKNGEGTLVEYPTYRELGDRFGITHTSVGEYAAKHNCLRRRIEAEARVRIKADEKLIEMRATAIALSKDDELRIIDTYMTEFENALATGRVRFDSPADFNTMARLKEFLQGGADARQEIHASLTLEDIQARHRRMQNVINAPAAERGEPDLADCPPALSPTFNEFPPAAAPAERAEESDRQTPGRFAPGQSSVSQGFPTASPASRELARSAADTPPEPQRAGPRWPASAPPASASASAAIAAEAGEGVATSGAVASAAGVPTLDPQNPGDSVTSTKEFAGAELAPEVLHGDEEQR